MPASLAWPVDHIEELSHGYMRLSTPRWGQLRAGPDRPHKAPIPEAPPLYQLSAACEPSCEGVRIDRLGIDAQTSRRAGRWGRGAPAAANAPAERGSIVANS